MEKLTVYVEFEHDESHPFCRDETCPCHNDYELLADVGELLGEHRISEHEAALIIYGQMAMPALALVA